MSEHEEADLAQGLENALAPFLEESLRPSDIAHTVENVIKQWIEPGGSDEFAVGVTWGPEGVLFVNVSLREGTTGLVDMHITGYEEEP